MSLIRHVVIRGRVQGVGYRAWTQYTALDRGLDGWVRNRRDGSVEAVFAGAPEAVAAMIEACRRGPPGALVDELEERDGTPADPVLRRRGERFSVLSTA
ncbi:MAG TPA: acylphosphatase [Roseiarcus sp.]|jgi:acylphosphatase|nr:acylphosphatase [Roseiarcus sp.]